MATTETDSGIVEGVHRCGSRRVNWYLVEGNEGLTVVDTGFPIHWESCSTGSIRWATTSTISKRVC